MREDEVVVAAIQRLPMQSIELAGDAIGERDAARGAPGLVRVELRARSCAVCQSTSRPVDIAPAQREQLSLAHAGHRGGQIHAPLRTMV